MKNLLSLLITILILNGCSNIQNKTSQVFDNANDALKSDPAPFWMESEKNEKKADSDYDKKINNYISEDTEKENLY